MDEENQWLYFASESGVGKIELDNDCKQTMLTGPLAERKHEYGVDSLKQKPTRLIPCDGTSITLSIDFTYPSLLMIIEPKKAAFPTHSTPMLIE